MHLLMRETNTTGTDASRSLTMLRHNYAIPGFTALLLFVLCSLCSPLSMAAQAPNISYTGVAPTYPLNVAISPLMPMNTGGVVAGIAGIAGAVTTLAGSGAYGYADGTGTSAQFSYPSGVAVDGAGNVYVGDTYNQRIRKISPLGVVSTLAGSGTPGYADGPGTSAQFADPFGVAVDGAGNVYVADTDNQRIRKISPLGVVTTLVGSGTPGYADGTGTSAQFNRPRGVAVDGAGNVYVGDTYNHRIRKISPTGVVSTLAGSGTLGYADGPGTSAQFKYPYSVAVDGIGNVYVADPYDHRIRKISPTGVVSTLAGSGTLGYADGAGAAAQFSYPFGVAVDGAGNVYVGDPYNHSIRKISPLGVVSTLAGSGTPGYADGAGAAAQFSFPLGVAVDGAGNVYVGDHYNHRIRKISQYGFSINPALPAGLSLDGSGTISGTPTVATASTTYTITGTNAGGSSTTTITFAVALLPSAPSIGVVTQPTCTLATGSVVLTGLPATRHMDLDAQSGGRDHLRQRHKHHAIRYSFRHLYI